MAAPLFATSVTCASLAELARHTGPSVRTLRELIRLGAVDKAWLDATGKLIYAFEHVEQVKRAKRLLDAGLTVRDAAQLCEAFSRAGRVPAGLSLPSLRHVRGQATTWETDGVQITVSPDCRPEALRLVDALKEAINSTRNREKALRRKLAAGGL